MPSSGAAAAAEAAPQRRDDDRSRPRAATSMNTTQPLAVSRCDESSERRRRQRGGSDDSGSAARDRSPQRRPLSAAEREKSMERLYFHPLKGLVRRREEQERYYAELMRQREVPRGALTRCSPQADERHFYQPMRKLKEERRKLQDKYAPDAEFRRYVAERGLKERIDREEEEGLGQRLCRASLEHRQKVLQAAKQRIYGPPVVGLRLSRQRAREVGDRLCNSSLAHKAESLAKLEERYLFKQKPVKRIDPSKSSDIFTRLSSRK